MFWLKGCKHCGGDLYEVNDLGERYIKCLQCGREVYNVAEITVEPSVVRPKAEARRRVSAA
ncbi:MAG: hypothetical protein HY681_02365 [Chloroflexi bacterium]|nr:hypothetical protein [Chloroflexota bacterium]